MLSTVTLYANSGYSRATVGCDGPFVGGVGWPTPGQRWPRTARVATFSGRRIRRTRTPAATAAGQCERPASYFQIDAEACLRTDSPSSAVPFHGQRRLSMDNGSATKLGISPDRGGLPEWQSAGAHGSLVMGVELEVYRADGSLIFSAADRLGRIVIGWTGSQAAGNIYVPEWAMAHEAVDRLRGVLQLGVRLMVSSRACGRWVRRCTGSTRSTVFPRTPT